MNFFQEENRWIHEDCFQRNYVKCNRCEWSVRKEEYLKATRALSKQEILMNLIQYDKQSEFNSY